MFVGRLCVYSFEAPARQVRDGGAGTERRAFSLQEILRRSHMASDLEGAARVLCLVFHRDGAVQVVGVDSSQLCCGMVGSLLKSTPRFGAL